MKINKAQLAATLKRVAKTLTPLEKQREKIASKIAKLNEELQAVELQKNIFEDPIVQMTGHKVFDLVQIETVESGTNKNGNTTYKTIYTLKYPETVVPEEEFEEGDNELEKEEDNSETDSVDKEVPFEEDNLF